MPSEQQDRIDSFSSGTAIKAPCTAATTVDITLSGLQTVGGVALAEGGRVLVKDQTLAKENGIWVVDTLAWFRASDFNGNRDVRYGTLVIVNNSGGAGSGPGDLYQVDTADLIGIGSTPMTFVPVLVSGVAVTLPIREQALGGINLGKGSNVPDEVIIGIAPALRFNRNVETANGNFALPVDMDKTKDITFHVVWAIEVLETDAHALKMDVDYVAYEIAGRETTDTPTSKTVTTTVTTANGLDPGDTYETDITFDAADSTNPLSGAEGICFELNFPEVQDGAGFVASALVLSVHMHYTALY